MIEILRGKQQLETLLQQFAAADVKSIAAISHPFFGKITPEEWGHAWIQAS